MGAGGAERVAALLCRQWIAQGHDVTLMPTYSRRGTCVYTLDDRVSLEFLADRFGGAREHPPTVLRRLSVLRQAVRELRPDVIVSFLTNVNIAALVATIGLGVPVVVSERNFPPRQKMSTFLRVLRRASYWRAAAVVAQTGGIADWLRRYCPGAKTVVIPNPVVVPIQKSESPLVPEQHLARGRRMILAVGRLVPAKGFDRLIEAFARIAQNLPDCDLVILGEGPERRALERLCEAHGITSRVQLPGHVGNVGDWYEAASVFVLTSHYEGFPNALLEAMAYGLPAVSVACATGPADIIRDGIDGVLVPGDSNAAGIAVAVRRIMHDEETREAMGRRAGEVAERFSMSSVGTSWNTLLLSARR
jgi:glycosyltransferase involved in cell wall biosynthesis